MAGSRKMMAPKICAKMAVKEFGNPKLSYLEFGEILKLKFFFTNFESIKHKDSVLMETDEPRFMGHFQYELEKNNSIESIES